LRRGPLAAFSLALFFALLCAGAAAAAPGGLGPPNPETDSGEAISDLYWAVFAVCAVVFVAVESALAAYRVNRVDFLTLLDSQMSLFSFGIGRAATVVNLNKALAEIALLTGAQEI